MRKHIFIFLGLSTLFFSANAYGRSALMPPKKKKTSGFDRTRLLLGPGVNFGAAQRSFFFTLAPSLGYAFTNNFYTGFTLSYSYLQTSDDLFNPYTNVTESFKFKSSSYGLSLFARYIIANRIILNVEPEMSSIKYPTSVYADPVSKKLKATVVRTNIPAMLLGVGYIQRFSEYGHTFLMVNYDVNQNPNSRYFETLDIRAGVMFSLFNR